ncbi:MAG: mevalonate kinase, partial [Polyangiales bacterium]
MGFGRGKIILLGEHAVVHGCPAIAVGIERGVHAEARLSNRDLLRLSPWELALEPDPDGGEPLERAFAAVLALYEARSPLEVDAEVDLPPGAGLGCSA